LFSSSQARNSSGDFLPVHNSMSKRRQDHFNDPAELKYMLSDGTQGEVEDDHLSNANRNSHITPQYRFPQSAVASEVRMSVPASNVTQRNFQGDAAAPSSYRHHHNIPGSQNLGMGYQNEDQNSDNLHGGFDEPSHNQYQQGVAQDEYSQLSPVLLGSPTISQQGFNVFRVPESFVHPLSQNPAQLGAFRVPDRSVQPPPKNAGRANRQAKKASKLPLPQVGEFETDSTRSAPVPGRSKKRRRKDDAIDYSDPLYAPVTDDCDDNDFRRSRTSSTSRTSSRPADFPVAQLGYGDTWRANAVAAGRDFQAARTPMHSSGGGDASSTGQTSYHDSATPWRRSDVNPFTPAYINFQGEYVCYL
jgi:hypothetical protein